MARSMCGSEKPTLSKRATQLCCKMLNCYLCRVLLLCDAVFVVLRGPSEPLGLSLVSKPDNNNMQNTAKPIVYNEYLYNTRCGGRTTHGGNSFRQLL